MHIYDKCIRHPITFYIFIILLSFLFIHHMHTDTLCTYHICVSYLHVLLFLYSPFPCIYTYILAYRWLRENNLAGEYVADTSEGSEAKLMTVDEVRLLYTCYIATVIVIIYIYTCYTVLCYNIITLCIHVIYVSCTPHYH